MTISYIPPSPPLILTKNFWHPLVKDQFSSQIVLVLLICIYVNQYHIIYNDCIPKKEWQSRRRDSSIATLSNSPHWHCHLSKSQISQVVCGMMEMMMNRLIMMMFVMMVWITYTFLASESRVKYIWDIIYLCHTLSSFVLGGYFNYQFHFLKLMLVIFHGQSWITLVSQKSINLEYINGLEFKKDKILYNTSTIKYNRIWYNTSMN